MPIIGLARFRFSAASVQVVVKEPLILQRASGRSAVIDKIQNKIKGFEDKYGKLDREKLYGKIDDMELMEWEGEMESQQKVQVKLKSLRVTSNKT